MEKYGLNKYSLTKLKEIAENMDLKPKRSKKRMIEEISKAFDEYEEYKRETIDKYTKKSRISSRIHIVTDEKNIEYVMKTFRKRKSSKKMQQEYEYQQLAFQNEVAPKVYEIDTVNKYITMEPMEKSLIDLITKQKGILRKKQQERIVEIFLTLDRIGIYHGKPDLKNFMVKNKEILIIDFGSAVKIDRKLIARKKSANPNMSSSLPKFIKKLRDKKLPEQCYKYLEKYVGA